MTSGRKVGNRFGYSKKDTKENFGSGNNMEELLNKLIEKGWKPFGITCTDFIKGTGLECIPSYCFNPHPHMGFPGGTRKYHRPSLRQIVSKESGLWQFVCEKGLVKKDGDINKDMEKYMYKCEYMDGCGDTINYWKRSKFTHHYFYEYFIIESALCDEDKLEDFILDNVKIGND